jgi:hypothetical protein
MGKAMAEELSVHEILQRLQSGSLSPNAIDKGMRRDCLEVLELEGRTQSAMAKLFEVADKTIQRDFKAIRERNRLRYDATDVQERLGWYARSVGNDIQYLRRLSRSAADESVRILALKTLNEIQVDHIKTMQSLGYMPLEKHTMIQIEKLGGKKPPKMPEPEENLKEFEKVIEPLSPMDRERLIKSLEKYFKKLSELSDGEEPPPLPSL